MKAKLLSPHAQEFDLNVLAQLAGLGLDSESVTFKGLDSVSFTTIDLGDDIEYTFTVSRRFKSWRKSRISIRINDRAIHDVDVTTSALETQAEFLWATLRDRELEIVEKRRSDLTPAVQSFFALVEEAEWKGFPRLSQFRTTK